MVRMKSEGGESSLTPPIVKDEGLSDDEDEDEDTNTSDEEKEINDDKEDSDVWLHMLSDMEEMVGIDFPMATRVGFRLTASLLLPLELDSKGDTHKLVGENASLFIRSISNEVSRVPFHYTSWDRVPEDDKLGIYRTLHHYFDLQDCARRYGMRETGTSSMLMDWREMHFEKGDGWVNEAAGND
ncbi:hypothetical protein R6Q59_025725 [Mikania micrantha]